MKDAGLRIRVQRELREKFLAVCRAQDKPAAQVLREFMRKYVTEHEAQLPDAGDDSDRATREHSKTGNGQG
jgi:predicted DNA-binding protein